MNKFDEDYNRIVRSVGALPDIITTSEFRKDLWRTAQSWKTGDLRFITNDLQELLSWMMFPELNKEKDSNRMFCLYTEYAPIVQSALWKKLDTEIHGNPSADAKPIWWLEAILGEVLNGTERERLLRHLNFGEKDDVWAGMEKLVLEIIQGYTASDIAPTWWLHIGDESQFGKLTHYATMYFVRNTEGGSKWFEGQAAEGGKERIEKILYYTGEIYGFESHSAYMAGSQVEQKVVDAVGMAKDVQNIANVDSANQFLYSALGAAATDTYSVIQRDVMYGQMVMTHNHAERALELAVAVAQVLGFRLLPAEDYCDLMLMFANEGVHEGVIAIESPYTMLFAVPVTESSNMAFLELNIIRKLQEAMQLGGPLPNEIVGSFSIELEVVRSPSERFKYDVPYLYSIPSINRSGEPATAFARVGDINDRKEAVNVSMTVVRNWRRHCDLFAFNLGNMENTYDEISDDEKAARMRDFSNSVM